MAMLVRVALMASVGVLVLVVALVEVVVVMAWVGAAWMFFATFVMAQVRVESRVGQGAQ